MRAAAWTVAMATNLTGSEVAHEQLRLAQRANAHARGAVDELLRLLVGAPDKEAVFGGLVEEIRTTVARAFLIGYAAGELDAKEAPHNRYRGGRK